MSTCNICTIRPLIAAAPTDCLYAMSCSAEENVLILTAISPAECHTTVRSHALCICPTMKGIINEQEKGLEYNWRRSQRYEGILIDDASKVSDGKHDVSEKSGDLATTQQTSYVGFHILSCYMWLVQSHPCFIRAMTGCFRSRRSMFHELCLLRNSFHGSRGAAHALTILSYAR